MPAAGLLLLLGSVLVSSVHGSAELNAALDYGETTTVLNLKPVNGTFGSDKYYIPAVRAKWIGAIMHCAKIGGVLTDVRSRSELDFLQKLARQAGGDTYAHWVGAGALGENKSFVWVRDHTPVGTELWAGGEPRVEKGNCVLLSWKFATPGLFTFTCFESPRRFICKFPA